jgi:D-alanyl-lipoteichoic acid acyltransferase DltB (MBOAT superfamily)
MYLPLGGKTRRFVTAPLIFSFIGLWHDLEIRWLAWALLNCACLVIEALVSQTAWQYGARTGYTHTPPLTRLLLHA